ncbi:MAG: S-layer homology domain-containing protein [Oscillospiraceae bacterium]|nr:S-layer homology domain-containing protein [Oscillospiraceae bacterium]
MRKRILALLLTVVLCLSLLPLAASAASVEDYPLLYSTFNSSATQSGPEYFPDFTVGSNDLLVQAIATYHWNSGRGATPGTISIYDWDDNLIGTWQATGRSGSGANNVYWDVFPNVVLKAGQRYYIVDSDTKTWSYNSASDNMGFAEVRGTAAPSGSSGSGGSSSSGSTTTSSTGYTCSTWAAPELSQADSMGLIPDVLKTADLTRSITRKEFAAVCVQVYNYMSGTPAVAGENPFKDTSDPDVLKAYAVGIVNGTAPDKFSPDDLLTREQAATMLTRCYKKIVIPGWTLPTDGNYTLNFTQPPLFADDWNISDYARTSVYFMAANGILNGMGENMFVPKGTATIAGATVAANATREQAVIISSRMAQNLDTTPQSTTTTPATPATPATPSGEFGASIPANGPAKKVGGLTLDFGSGGSGTFTVNTAAAPEDALSACYEVDLSDADNHSVTITTDLTSSVPEGMEACIGVGIPYKTADGESDILWNLVPTTVSGSTATATIDAAAYQNYIDDILLAGGQPMQQTKKTTTGLNLFIAAIGMKKFESAHFVLRVQGRVFDENAKGGLTSKDSQRILNDLEAIYTAYTSTYGYKDVRNLSANRLSVTILPIKGNDGAYYAGDVSINDGYVYLNANSSIVMYGYRSPAAERRSVEVQLSKGNTIHSDEDFFRTMAHEMFHYFQNQYINSTVFKYTSGNDWFHEGSAMYYEQVLAKANGLNIEGAGLYRQEHMDVYSGLVPGDSISAGGYGRRPFFQYLEEQIGSGTIRQTYAAYEAAKGMNPGFETLLPGVTGKTLPELAVDFYRTLVTTNKLEALDADPWTIYDSSVDNFHNQNRNHPERKYLNELNIDSNSANAESDKTILVYPYGTSFLKVVPNRLPSTVSGLTIAIDESANASLTVMTFQSNDYSKLKVYTDKTSYVIPLTAGKILVMVTDTSGSQNNVKVVVRPSISTGSYHPSGEEEIIPSDYEGTLTRTVDGVTVSVPAKAELTLGPSSGYVYISADDGSYTFSITGGYYPAEGILSAPEGSACIYSDVDFADKGYNNGLSAQSLGCNLSAVEYDSTGAVIAEFSGYYEGTVSLSTAPPPPSE